MITVILYSNKQNYWHVSLELRPFTHESYNVKYFGKISKKTV